MDFQSTRKHQDLDLPTLISETIAENHHLDALGKLNSHVSKRSSQRLVVD